VDTWFYEVSGEVGRLGSVPPTTRLSTVVEAIRWTLDQQSSDVIAPFEADRRSREFVRSMLARADQAIAQDCGAVPSDQALDDTFEDLTEDTQEPGMAHMLSAVIELCDDSGELTTEAVGNILFWCYDGTVNRQYGVHNDETAQQNQKCRDAIAFQLALIDRNTATN
jgi:hypothetical protein